MDVPRKNAKGKRRTRQTIYILLIVIALGAVTFGVSKLKPAAPGVERNTLYQGTVTRGLMLRQVRGLGTLVPEDINFVPAQSTGRIEQRMLQPGEHVTPSTVLFVMTNPDLEQATGDIESQVRAAEADLASLKVQLQKQFLDIQAAAAQVASDFQRSKMEAEVFEGLGKQGLKSDLEVKTKQIERDNLKKRNDIENSRLAIANDEIKARTASQEERVQQLRETLKLRRQQVENLKVRAGIDGVLQAVSVQVGQQVTVGQELARVANPSHLKAELKVAETQAVGIAIGQLVSVDTRNGLIPGKVSRIDPAIVNGTRTVDVALEGELPKGAVPDLSVDGTIQLERLDNVLYVGRPVHGTENQTVGLFKLTPDGTEATRVQVKLGRSSVTTFEILDGLKEGDIVILSDTSQWDNVDRIRLN